MASGDKNEIDNDSIVYIKDPKTIRSILFQWLTLCNALNYTAEAYHLVYGSFFLYFFDTVEVPNVTDTVLNTE